MPINVFGNSNSNDNGNKLISNFEENIIWISFRKLKCRLIFGNSSSNNDGNEIDTSLFVQKPYLRTTCIESNLEEDIDSKKTI